MILSCMRKIINVRLTQENKKMPKPLTYEVAERLLILKYQVVHALALPPHEFIQSQYSTWSKKKQKEFSKGFKGNSDHLINSLKSLKLWKKMTRAERDFINSIPPKVKPQFHLNAMWCLESAVVLMWAMKLIEEFPPFDYQSNREILKKIPHENVGEFIDDAVLRADEIIENKRSLAELWHWRSRTRRLIEMNEVPPQELGFTSFDEIVQKSAELALEHGDIPHVVNNDYPAKGKAYRDLSDEEWSEVRSITMERHHALNWLCGYAPGNKWDQTPTDT